MIDKRPTPLHVHVPTVLAVGLEPDVLARAQAVLAPTGVALRSSNLLDLRSDSAESRPLILLVDAELYDFDPEAFDMVALDVSAKLGVCGSATEAEVTLTRLLAAMIHRGGEPKPAERSGEGRPTEAPAPEERTNRWSFSPAALGIEAEGS